jgi:uncharacterized protein YecE (DUF72 family)
MKKQCKYYIGTSGWFYQWNLEKSLDWYINNTGFNAVELNASFYRFPFPNQIKKWAKTGSKLRWSVKVSRRITHLHKFSLENSTDIWKKFYNLFQPLDPYIDFYLFQAHPKFSDENKELLQQFYAFTELGKRFAFEARHDSWFKETNIQWIKKLGLTFISIDSPKIQNAIFNNNGTIYLRMHGRNKWYSHYYTDEELIEIKSNILQSGKINKLYIFFNNDNDMLVNAQKMKLILNS